MPGPHQIGEQLGLASVGDGPGGSAHPVVVRVSVMVPGGEDQVAGLDEAGQLGPQSAILRCRRRDDPVGRCAPELRPRQAAAAADSRGRR